MKPDIKCLSSEYHFATEMKMYVEIVPAMERVLQSIDNPTVFGGKLIAHSNEPIDHMIFEDLCESNYVVPLRGNSLGYDGAKLVYEKMARWHATSYYLASIEGVNYTGFNKYMFNNEASVDGIVELGESCADAITITLESWPQFKKYQQNLIYFVENMRVKGIQVYKPNPNGFNVLNHGDLHPKNVMVKYDDCGVVKEVLFVSENFLLLIVRNN